MNTHQPWMLLLCLLWSATLVSKSAGQDAVDEKFIGWKGEVYRPKNTVNKEELHKPNDVIIGGDAPKPSGANRWIRQVSWRPRAYLFKNFIEPEMADHLIKLAKPQMKRSMVVDDNTESGFAVSNYRTSYGMFFRRNQNPIIKEIQRRVSSWTHLPEVNQEDMQILRYTSGQQYRPHSDVLDDDEDGSRIATVLIYLNDCYEGGETAFPIHSEWTDKRLADEMGPWSDCANGHVAVKARKGDALLFFSLTPDGRVDKHSEHAGCPVPEPAVKWTATIWIHTEPFRAYTFNEKGLKWDAQDAGDCIDYVMGCQRGKEHGDCERRADYMMGDLIGDGGLGVCRKTCGVCEVCEKNDRECYFQNREKAGYLNLDDLWPKGTNRTATVYVPKEWLN